MHKKIITLLFILLSITQIARSQASADTAKQVDIQLPFTIKWPNDQWYLAVNEAPNHYIFKRQPIGDAEGHSIIPAVMIYVGDASNYKQDVSIFWSKGMQPLTDKGVRVQKVLIYTDNDYPLSYKNAIFVNGEYTDHGIDHIIHMIYIIDNHDRGIQVYLDMTKEVEGIYGHEFWDIIRSIKEKN